MTKECFYDPEEKEMCKKHKYSTPKRFEMIIKEQVDILNTKKHCIKPCKFLKCIK